MGQCVFRNRESILYMTNWINERVLYVKDLAYNHGIVKNGEELYNMIHMKNNIYKEILIVKRCVLKRIQNVNCSITPYIKIKKEPTRLKSQNAIGNDDVFLYSE